MRKKNKLYFHLLIVCVIVLGFVGNIELVWANNHERPMSQQIMAGSAEECYGIDLVIIVDQSGSMSREIIVGDQTFPPNDPNNRRVEAVYHAMDWLASNRLGLCTDVVHRIGVVGFGTDAKVYIPLNEGIISPDNHEDWVETFYRFRNQYYGEDLGITSTKRGFEVAQELYSEAGEIGDAPRKNLMIMITDGKPNPLGRGSSYEAQVFYLNEMKEFIQDNFYFDESIIAREEAMQRVINIYGSLDQIPVEVRNNVLADYPVTPDAYQSSYFVFFMAMNDAMPYLDTVGGMFEEIAEMQGGVLFDLDDNEISVLTTINQILSRVTGLSSLVVDCDPIAVLPYLSGVSLDFYKLSSAIEVIIVLDSHELINGGDMFGGDGDASFWGVDGYSVYGATEHYLFRQPPGGIWEFKTDVCRDIKASFRVFKPEIVLEESNLVFPHYPSPDDKFDPSTPYNFRFYIEDSNTGIPLVNDENYPIDMIADITMPGGEVEQVKFDFDIDDNHWLSTAVPVYEQGTASFVLTAEAECVGYPSELCPEPVFSVVSWEGEYLIGEVNHIVWSIIEPVDGSVSELNGPPLALPLLPLDVEIEVRNQDNTPLSYPEWVVSGEDSQNVFSAKLILPDGDVITKPLVARADNPARFYTTFDFLDDGRFVQGTYDLEVSMRDAWQRDQFFPELTQQSVSFTRQNPFFRTQWFWNGVKILSGVTVAAILGKIIYDHTNVVTGSLVFSNTSQEDKAFSLSKKKRRLVIKKHPSLRELGLRRIVVKNNPTSRSSGSMPISVTLERNDKRQFQMTLADVKTGRYPDSNNVNWQLTYSGGKQIKQKRNRPKPGRRGSQRPRKRQ
jgi:hypothetical protein